MAALIGALVGAVPAYVSSQNQIAAEDARSSSEFQRDQQEGAYVGLATAHDKLVNLARSGAVGDAERKEAVDEYEAATTIVRLKGSAEASSLMDVLRIYLEAWSTAATTWRAAFPDRAENGPDREMIFPDTLSIGRTELDAPVDFTDLLEIQYYDFLEVARDDLAGVPPDERESFDGPG
jgi:hypothetical protein